MKNPFLLEIAGRKIGRDFPPFVIVEIDINHEGSVSKAKQMIDAAKRLVEIFSEMLKLNGRTLNDKMKEYL